MMNLEPPPLPPPPRLTSCNLHPDQPVTGFCASCLRERLAGLDPASSSNHRNPTLTSTSSSSALKAIFKTSSSSKSAFPELRRSKSFSGARADGIPVIVEPQRKSCDVRVRNTLWSLFHQDEGTKVDGATSNISAEIEQLPNGGKNLNLGGFDEVKELEEIEDEGEEDDQPEGEIRVLESEIRAEETVVVVDAGGVEEEEEEEEEEGGDVRTMKDHIDLDAQMSNQTVEKRDLKEIAGSFWLAASVLSKKLQKWRMKKKKRRSGRDHDAATERVGRPAFSSRHFRETQSEVADYGYGRRSCDTDPRFSLDAGRFSLDDPLVEPRASWDGYLIGRAASAASTSAASFPRMPLMDSVVEDAPAPVRRSDNLIPVEDPISSDPPPPTTMPGGSVQTTEYYRDSSSSIHRRRHSLERSSSTRRVGSTSGETEETKWISNSKVSPATMDYFFVNKIADTKDSNLNSSLSSAYRGGSAAIAGKASKKSRRWSKAWNIWGLIHWRGSSKDGEDDRYSRGNVVERSFSESWPELRRGANIDPKGAFAYNRKMLRSNSSVSWRSSFSNATVGGIRSGIEVNGNGKNRRQEIVLERNRSARFSPSHFDNGGLLRFYLTPLTGGRRNGGGFGKSRSKSLQSFAGNVRRLY